MPKVNVRSSKESFFRFAFFILLFGVLIAVGYFGYIQFKKSKSTTVQQAPQIMEIEVPVISVNFESHSLSLQLPARIYSSEISEIRPQVSGTLEEIHFKEGTYIQKGKQLYTIDQTPYLATYNKAKSNLKTATDNKNRNYSLFKAGAISKQTYESYINAFEVAKWDLVLAKTNLEYTKVFAPISGFISKSNFTKGALLTQGQMQPIATIASLSPIYAEISIPRKELLKIKNESKLKVEVMAEGVMEVGVLDFAEVLVNQNTDSVILRATLRNESKNLLPGMYVDAKVYLRPKMVISIPQKATFRRPDGSLNVFIINAESKVETRVVQEEIAIDDKWILKGGLQSGDVILYEGFQKVKDGVKVKPIHKMQEAK